jgi:hypothetical protein
LEVSASRWAISRVVSDGAGRAGGGEVAAAAVGVGEGGVGERVMVMSMATREMGCGGGFLGPPRKVWRLVLNHVEIHVCTIA